MRLCYKYIKYFGNKQSVDLISSATMSIPALRQPKLQPPIERKQALLREEIEHIILTLKDDQKLVVSSDAQHGIITAGAMYKCVFCNAEFELSIKLKEFHKSSMGHRKAMSICPLVEELPENLLWKINSTEHYCTTCNVVTQFLMRHVHSEPHRQEYARAVARADIYKPKN